MSTRTFGPTLGAGTRIEEQSGAQELVPGALGWAAYAGLTRKGRPNKLTLLSTATDFAQQIGGVIPEGFLADCASDFYQLANGAGGLGVVRLTDGNELKASRKLYNRRVGTAQAAVGLIEADNGGRWGGQAHKFLDVLDSSAGLLETTLQIGTTNANAFKVDEWKGGFIVLSAVSNKQYPIIGNTATGLITVASDSKMKTDFGVATDLKFYLQLDNGGQALSVQIDDGKENPGSEFSLNVFENGNSVKGWDNLSTDPTSARYWVNIINNDSGNFWITVTDLWTGAQAPDIRPANIYGVIASITATVLTATIFSMIINSPGGGNPTVALPSVNDTMVEQDITITMSSATAGTAVSSRFGALGAVTLGTPFASPNRWTPGFTVTAGTSPLASTNTLVIQFRPFAPGSLVGGFIYPDKVNAKRVRYQITANDHNTITVAGGNDMTSVGAVADQFMVSAAQELFGGRDGNSSVVDATYIQAWDTNLSPFNDLNGKNLGLVKLATPGITSTAVQKAGVAYARAKNHQYRFEFDPTIVTESAALDFVNDTLGRDEYEVTAFPSYGMVPDPDPAASREGRLKQIPLTGMIHGREAQMAVTFGGYHRAAAGTTATLPRLLSLPTKDKTLNEELLNPAGINVIKKLKGTYIIWGDRTVHLDTQWKFKHQRELMSYYEHVLQDNFDFIMFAINDETNDNLAKASLTAFFLTEWQPKRALRGKTFKDACIIKVDDELNTALSRANGDEIASVALQLADTVERFIIRIGKQGIFEATA
jgi:hypothetical protein